MPERRPDVAKVVVLAADAHALLGGGGARIAARLAAEEHVLELVHAGVGEEERGVLMRHERRTGDDTVRVAFEERKKRSPDFLGSHARHFLTPTGQDGLTPKPLRSLSRRAAM